MNKTILIIMAAILGLILLVGGWAVGINNQLVSLEQDYKSTLAQVENVYQRRADLIPNLVNTVKGYAKHEAEVLEEVTRARSQAGQVKLDSPESIARYEKAQGQVSSALSRLLVISENYPDLKANQNFRDLQAQLEGTENRISVERKRMIDAIQTYNSYIKKFPQVVIASFRGFKEIAYFEAAPESKAAPKVQF